METYYRPEFDRNAFDSARPNCQEQEDHPHLLGEMELSDTFIGISGSIAKYDARHPMRSCVESALISFAFNFVQYQVDLSKPDEIRDACIFYRDMLVKYAPHYVDENGKHFTNCNLGELHHELTKSSPKRSIQQLAFSIKSLLTMEKAEEERTNHMAHSNHTIDYHLYTSVLDAMKSMSGLEITDESFSTVVDENIALVDSHTRCGTRDKGNTFPEFRDEVNDDPVMSKYCRRAQLKLDRKLRVGDEYYNALVPTTMDMLLGNFYMVLYTLYAYAKTGLPVHVLVATKRNHWVYNTNQDKAHIVNRIWVVGLAPHPNDNERFLTKNEFEEILRMDEAMSLALQPLDGCMVNYVDESNSLRSTRFVWGASDAFQRTNNYRKFEKTTKQRMEKLKKELSSVYRKIDRTIAMKNAQRVRIQQIKSTHEAKRKENESLQNKKYAAESAKRTKMEKSALALLSSIDC